MQDKMTLFRKMKKHISDFKIIWDNLSPYSYDCPNCALTTNERLFEALQPSARVLFMKNELYKKPNFYVKCKVCGFTTPAYDTSKEALDAWNDSWVTTESIIANKMIDGEAKNASI